SVTRGWRGWKKSGRRGRSCPGFRHDKSPGSLLLLFCLLRRTATPYIDGLSDRLALVIHVTHLNGITGLEVGRAHVLAALLDFGLGVDGKGPLGVLALLLAGDDHAIG